MPLRAANAVRELAKVLTRMPKAATRKLPEMPTTLNARMMATWYAAICCMKPK